MIPGGLLRKRNYLTVTVAPAASSLALASSAAVLVDLLEQRLGGAVDEILGLLEAQAGDDLADDLDDADLLLAGTLEDDVELRLLLGGLGGSGCASRRRQRRPGRRR